jgi:hypothetical protein
MVTIEVGSFKQLKRVAFQAYNGATYKFHSLAKEQMYVSTVYVYSVSNQLLAFYKAKEMEISVSDKWIQTNEMPDQDAIGYNFSMLPSIEVVSATQ